MATDDDEQRVQELETEIREAHRELERLGVPPDQKLPKRIRNGLVSRVEAQALIDKAAAQPARRRLPDTRYSLTHKFSVGGHEGYFTVGMYDDGAAGELFVRMAKEGSTISGLMDSFAVMVSLGLQHGVPLKTMVDKMKHTQFDPQGFTADEDIRRASSLMDYIFRWLERRFLPTPPAVVVTESMSGEASVAITVGDKKGA